MWKEYLVAARVFVAFLAFWLFVGSPVWTANKPKVFKRLEKLCEAALTQIGSFNPGLSENDIRHLRKQVIPALAAQVALGNPGVNSAGNQGHLMLILPANRPVLVDSKHKIVYALEGNGDSRGLHSGGE